MDTTESTRKEAALSLFKALQVYPQPKELMQLFDKTVPKVCRVGIAMAWNAANVVHSLCWTRWPRWWPTTT